MDRLGVVPEIAKPCADELSFLWLVAIADAAAAPNKLSAVQPEGDSTQHPAHIKELTGEDFFVPWVEQLVDVPEVLAMEANTLLVVEPVSLDAVAHAIDR